MQPGVLVRFLQVTKGTAERNRRTVGQDRPVGTAAETDDGQGTKTFPDFQKYPVFACRISGIFRVIFCRALLLFLPWMGTMGKTRPVC